MKCAGEWNDPLIFSDTSDEIWLGLGDGQAEGVWRWVDSRPANYTNFDSSEPNGDQSQSCIRAEKESGGSTLWRDAYCNRPYYVVCQSPPGTLIKS